jgi:hypothetical protein
LIAKIGNLSERSEKQKQKKIKRKEFLTEDDFKLVSRKFKYYQYILILHS